MITRRSFLGAMPLLAAGQSPARRPPNIVFILADDLGWTALRTYRDRYSRTPNLDRLAGQGVRFTHAYVTPQCTPTRASLLTGQHTARNKMWHVIPGYGCPWARVEEPQFKVNMDRGTPTVAAALRPAGYATACIGKWHLTANQDGQYEQLFPEAAAHYGFDYAPARHNPPGVQGRGDKGVNQFTDQALDFIDRNRNRPFFLYLSHHSIHGPVLAPGDLVKQYRARGYRMEGIHNTVYLAAIEHLDASIGRVMKKLDEWSLAENTIVVFLSDNGGIETLFSNTPLRAGKGSAYEGGIRVPAIVRWPGKVRAGTVNDTPIHVVDWYPTLLDLAGASRPENHPLDGVSLRPLLTGGSLPARPLYWYMPLYDIQWGAVPSAIIQEDGFKLIESFGDYIDVDRDYEYSIGNRLELFNLREDIGETRNLAESMPDRVKAMRSKLHAWIESMGAVRPGLNPNYDPARALERGDRKQG